MLEDREERADRLARNLALNRFEHVDVLRKVSALDALLDEGWFTGLDVVKLGRDHVSRDVLEGARGVIESFGPVVLLEGAHRDGPDVSEWLRDLGYRFYRVDREAGLSAFSGAPPYGWAAACLEGVDLG